jgi:hypothetical protein
MTEEGAPPPEAEPGPEAQADQTKPELDPRAADVREKFVALLSCAESVWRDALQSQVTLAACLDQLQLEIAGVRQFTQIPSYPAGMKKLQGCQNRVLAVKKRIAAAGGRLAKISVAWQQQALARQHAILRQRAEAEAAQKVQQEAAALQKAQHEASPPDHPAADPHPDQPSNTDPSPGDPSKPDPPDDETSKVNPPTDDASKPDPPSEQPPE